MNRGPEPGDCSGAHAAPDPVEHFFRHEYGRLVALLTRKVSVRHLDLLEDAVQGVLLVALTAWTAHSRPDDPGAWLYRVASNSLMGDLRRTAGRHRILERAVDTSAERADSPAAPYFAAEVFRTCRASSSVPATCSSAKTSATMRSRRSGCGR